MITDAKRLKTRKVEDLVQIFMEINIKSQIDKRIAKEIQTEIEHSGGKTQSNSK